MTNIPDKELKFSVYKEVTQIDQKAENLSEKWAPPQKKKSQKKHMLKTYILKPLGSLLIKPYSLKDDIFFPD